MTPVQRLLSQLQKDQSVRNSRFNEDGEKVCCFKAEDEANGIVWAIASHRSAALRAEPCFTVSALRAAAAIARGGK